MALIRIAPRTTSRAAAPGPDIPVFPGGRAPRWLGWLIMAAALLPVVIAIVDDRAGLRLVMAAFAAVLVTVGVGVLVMFASIEPGVVRIDPDAAGLRFAPPASATLPPVVMAISLLLPAIAQATSDASSLPSLDGSILLSRGAYAAGVLGLVILAVRLWQLRTPSGLELTPDGLRGIRGRAVVNWSWSDLADVVVVAGPAARLSLVPTGNRRPVLAPALALGSDPNQVAAIVAHYLARPAERPALAEGGAAAVSRMEIPR